MKYTKTIMLALIIMIGASVSLHAQQQKITSIGSAISRETADQWIQNFKTKYPTVLASHKFSKATLQEILATDGLAGIYLYNGLDTQGNIKLILKGCDENGDLISSANDIADYQMLEDFKNSFKDRPQAQLFGREIFEKMLAFKNMEVMLFAHAINEKGEEKMVLVSIDKIGKPIDPPTDNGTPCPPYCPASSVITSRAK